MTPKTEYRSRSVPEAGIRINTINGIGAEAVAEIHRAIDGILLSQKSDAVTLLALQVLHDATKASACTIHDCNFIMGDPKP